MLGWSLRFLRIGLCRRRRRARWQVGGDCLLLHLGGFLGGRGEAAHGLHRKVEGAEASPLFPHRLLPMQVPRRRRRLCGRCRRLRPAARSLGGAPVAAACRPRAENRARSDFGFLWAGVGAGAPSSASQRKDVKVIRPQHPPPWPIASLLRAHGRAPPQEAFARSGAAHAPLLNKYYYLASI